MIPIVIQNQVVIVILNNHLIHKYESLILMHQVEKNMMLKIHILAMKLGRVVIQKNVRDKVLILEILEFQHISKDPIQVMTNSCIQ